MLGQTWPRTVTQTFTNKCHLTYRPKQVGNVLQSNSEWVCADDHNFPATHPFAIRTWLNRLLAILTIFLFRIKCVSEKILNFCFRSVSFVELDCNISPTESNKFLIFTDLSQLMTVLSPTDCMKLPRFSHKLIADKLIFTYVLSLSWLTRVIPSFF